ncbi:MAG: prepilin peptidase [Candidatus Parcubacteria bacterium]|nr:prepilin peptidase [Candidatus Parcubacteria bacterium]
MTIIIYVFSVLLGLTIGSFLNCLVYRLHTHQTIMGRSFCPLCRKEIAWFDNIPLISFIILGGHCRRCQQRISWQYPLVELITGALFFLAAWRLNIFDPRYALLLARDWLMFFALIFIFVYDLKYYSIEDVVILPIAVAVFALNLLLKFSWINLILSGMGSAIFFLAQYFITRGRGIGFGDFRIGILLGLYFGWPQIALAIFLSYMIGSLVSLALVLLQRKGMKSVVPLGPFLAAGTLVAIFYGQTILNWYLSVLK